MGDILKEPWCTFRDYKQWLAVAEGRIAKYRFEVETIQKKKIISGESKIRRRALEFYIRKNEDLSKRLKEEVLSIAFSGSQEEAPRNFLGVAGETTSKILWLARLAAADITKLDSISNKYGFLCCDEYENVLQLYKVDRKKYYTRVTALLRERVIPDIVEATKNNHLLFARQKLILHALEQYSKRKYIITCSILSVQIEGLIYDSLVDLGESPELLDLWALREKCECLSRRAVDFVWAEYYALRFPVFRNQIAHGNFAPDVSLSEKTKDLLLDFWCICHFVIESKSLPTNSAVSVVKNCAGECPKRRNHYLWEYAQLNFVDIPAFYRLGRTMRSMRKAFTEDGFWKWCENDLAVGCTQGQLDKMIGLMNSIGKRFNVDSKAKHAVQEVIKKKKMHDAKVESELVLLKRLSQKKNSE